MARLGGRRKGILHEFAYELYLSRFNFASTQPKKRKVESLSLKDRFGIWKGLGIAMYLGSMFFFSDRLFHASRSEIMDVWFVSIRILH